MANFEIPENPKFTEEVRKFEEEDPGHADLFNAVVETLLGNEVFLKKLADSLARSISDLNTLTKYTTVVTPNPTIGPQIVQKESETFDLEGNALPFPIQEVVAGHEKAISQLNTDTKMLPVLNGEMRKIKFCTGTVYIRFDSDAFVNILMDDCFASATPIINVLGYPDVFDNATVYNNVIIVGAHKEFANHEAYVRYLVIGF